MLAIRMPIDRSTRGCVCGNLDLGLLEITHIPYLDPATVGAKRKIHAVRRRPLDISNAITLAGEFALALHLTGRWSTAPLRTASMPACVSDVPKSDSSILAAGQEQTPAVRIKSDAMHLPVMLMQLSSRQASMTQVVQDNLATTSGRGDIVARCTFRPGDIINVDCVDLPGLARGLGGGAADSSAQVDIFYANAILDLDRLENFLAAEEGMATTLVDRDRVDLEPGPVACCGILRGAQGGESIHAVEGIVLLILRAGWPRSVAEYPVRCLSGSLEWSRSRQWWRIGNARCGHGHGRAPTVRFIVHGGSGLTT